MCPTFWGIGLRWPWPHAPADPGDGGGAGLSVEEAAAAAQSPPPVRVEIILEKLRLSEALAPYKHMFIGVLKMANGQSSIQVRKVLIEYDS